MMTCQIRSGDGWRIGWNPNADSFYGLLAGQGWALELTAAEFQDFCRAAHKLNAEMSAIAELLMDEERVTCEHETATIWVEAEGFAASYGLRFILLTGRRGEGEWPAAVVPGLLSAIAQPPFAQITDSI
ncbi:MAG: DUF1818 family protein [Cyanobacteria bacterium P01_D01_bin.36]